MLKISQINNSVIQTTFLKGGDLAEFLPRKTLDGQCLAGIVRTIRVGWMRAEPEGGALSCSGHLGLLRGLRCIGSRT